MSEFLVVDEKWSVRFEPKNNDKPVAWYRYGEYQGDFVENNLTIAMFYALLDAKNEHALADREADRKRVRDEALREAAAWIECQAEGRFDPAACVERNVARQILALVEGKDR